MNVMINQPLNDTLCDERLAFAELARDLANKKLLEGIEENDRYPFGPLFAEAIKDAAVVGFYGVNLASEHGGVDMNAGMVAVILEQLSLVDSSLAGVVFTNAAALEIIRQASLESDCSSLYAGISSLGTAPLAFQSFSGPREIDMPQADGGGRVSGKARYLVLGNIADYAVIPAAQAGASGFSWYLVDLNDESIAKSKPIVSLGLHACPAVDISLRDTPCTLIGGPGCGLKYFDAMADGMSLCAAAMSLGVMKGSFQSALDYTADRYQGGRQIIDWPQVRMMLANMAIESKTGDALFSRARQEMENECQRWGFTARAAAVHIGELAVKSTADGIQLFGGNGYMKDYPQEKRFRDARQSQCLLGMAALKKIHYIADYIEENK